MAGGMKLPHMAVRGSSLQSGFTGLHLLCQSDTSLDCIDVMLANGANVHKYDEVQSPAQL